MLLRLVGVAALLACSTRGRSPEAPTTTSGTYEKEEEGRLPSGSAPGTAVTDTGGPASPGVPSMGSMQNDMIGDAGAAPSAR
jgi:hypothetical protein